MIVCAHIAYVPDCLRSDCLHSECLRSDRACPLTVQPASVQLMYSQRPCVVSLHSVSAHPLYSQCAVSAYAVSVQLVSYPVPFSRHLFLLCVFSICDLLAARLSCSLLSACGCHYNGEMWNDFDAETHNILYRTVLVPVSSSVS